MGKSGGVSNDKRKIVANRYPGEVSLVNMSKEEMDDFIDYMSYVHRGSYLDYLYSIIGPDKILLYLEILENMTVRIPPRKTLVKVIFYIKVYNYLKSRGFTEEAYMMASKIYKKRIFDLKRIVNKVNNVLESNSEKL